MGRQDGMCENIWGDCKRVLSNPSSNLQRAGLAGWPSSSASTSCAEA